MMGPPKTGKPPQRRLQGPLDTVQSDWRGGSIETEDKAAGPAPQASLYDLRKSHLARRGIAEPVLSAVVSLAFGAGRAAP